MAKPHATPPHAAGRQRLYTAIGWSVPVLFFLLLEGALRLAGFGDDYPLFVDLPQQTDYRQPNPDVIRRFFNHPDDAPGVSIDTGYFLRDKPADGLRIVVQGGSTAAGFPYGKNASPAGMLQQRLARTFPDRTVEVILTAMSAVNSYTLLDFADEIIAEQPDAVLVYAGHNEFLGVLGVGSALGAGHSRGLIRVYLRIRDWRVFQLMQRLIGALRPDRGPKTGTLMANIAGQRSIPLDSPLFRQGVTQFQSNLDALLRRYAAAGIPVFVGTLASNEKDQPPFHGGPPVPDSAGDWIARHDAARAQVSAGAFAAAAAAAETLIADETDAADGYFLLGRASLGLGDRHRAGAAFQNAIDRDRLRFRAPGVFERVIRDVAARHGATVVEVHAQLAQASPDGLIGHELMLEHLHPNADGYFLLADAFHDALKQAGLGLDWTHAVPDRRARLENPLTRIEQLHGGYRVASLMHDWPFVDEKQEYTLPPAGNAEEQIAQAWFNGQLDWLRAMNQGLVQYQRAGDYTEASRIAMNIADAFPFEAQPQHVAGQMLVRQSPPQGNRAIRYFHRAATLDPRNVPFLVTLARAYTINGYPDAARKTARRLLEIAPGNETALELLEHLDSGSNQRQ